MRDHARRARQLVTLVIGGLALVAVASTLTHSTADAMRADTQPLFVEVADGVLAVPTDPTVARARVVTVNFDALVGQAGTASGSPGATEAVTLNLFPDTQLRAVLDQASGSMDQPDQRLTWIGHVDGAPQDRVLIVAGDNTLAASVQTASGIYDVRYLGQGYHAVVQVNQGQFGPD